MELTEEQIMNKQTQLIKEHSIRNLANKFIDLQLQSENQKVFELSKQEILDEIDNFQFQIDKAEIQHYVRIRDQNYFQKKTEFIELEIVKQNQIIESLEKQYELERMKKNFKEEYDKLAQSINQFQEIQELEKRKQEIEDKINEIKVQREHDSKKIEIRQKQLMALLSNLEQLKQPIEDQKS